MSFEQMLHHGKAVIKSQFTGIDVTLLENAVGVAIITEFKGAWFVSGKLGRGFICKRLSQTKFSSPTAIVLGGAGIGPQWGGEKLDLVYVFLNKSELDAFAHSGHLSIGGETGYAIGKGSVASTAMNVGSEGVAATYAIGSTTGAYLGLSIEGTILLSSPISNRMFYGRSVKVTELLNSQTVPRKDTKATVVREIQTLLMQAVQNSLPRNNCQRIVPVDSDDEETGDEFLSNETSTQTLQQDGISRHDSNQQHGSSRHGSNQQHGSSRHGSNQQHGSSRHGSNQQHGLSRHGSNQQHGLSRHGSNEHHGLSRHGSNQQHGLSRHGSNEHHGLSRHGSNQQHGLSRHGSSLLFETNSSASDNEQEFETPLDHQGDSVINLAGNTTLKKEFGAIDNANFLQPTVSRSDKLYRLKQNHIVESHAAQVHHILSLPKNSTIKLLRGTLDHGLGGKYGGYVEVEVVHDPPAPSTDVSPLVGKVSRFILEPVWSN